MSKMADTLMPVGAVVGTASGAVYGYLLSTVLNTYSGSYDAIPFDQLVFAAVVLTIIGGVAGAFLFGVPALIGDAIMLYYWILHGQPGVAAFFAPVGFLVAALSTVFFVGRPLSESESASFKESSLKRRRERERRERGE
jgi:hypothetical protein